jgi:hypothetical protein
MVDQVVHRFAMRATLARLLDLLLRSDRAADARVVTEVPLGQVEAPAAAPAEGKAADAEHDEPRQ